jgi:Tfp pilus assembly protein PilF
MVSFLFLTIGFLRDAAAKDSFVRMDKRPLSRVVLFSVSTVLVLVIFTPKPIQELLNVSKQKYYTSRRGSIDIRMKMWRNGLEMFKDHPVGGFGIGNFKVWYPFYHKRAAIDPAFSEHKRPLNIHNDFLQAAIELGSIGFLLLNGLFVCSLFMVLRLSRHDQTPGVRLVSIGVGGGILAMLSTGMFSFPMQRSIPPLILFVYMGILVGYYHCHTPSPKSISIRVPRTVALFLCVLTIGATVMVTRFHYNLLVSDAHYRQSLQMARVGAWPEVVHSGLRSYEANPHKTAALEAIGWAYVELNELDKGIAALEKVLDAYPHNVKALGKLGDAYYKGGDHREAFETFERLIEIKGDLPDVLTIMGNICIKDERYREALGYFEQAIKYDQENPLLHTNLGFVKFKLGKYSEAAKEYEKALTFRPDMLYAHKSLVSIYGLYVKEPNKASFHAKRCAEIGGADCRPQSVGEKSHIIEEPRFLQGHEK